VLRYKPGGEYRPHFDYFPPNQTGSKVHLRRGGQRVATLIVYLNDVEAGGETIFPDIGMSVVARRGSAVYFRFMNGSRQLDPLTLHGGSPVLGGEKWIMTKWLREHAVVDECAKQDTIFVQMASYRDPQLIPTLVNMVRQSAHPSALRAVVCWQHASSETIDDFFANGFTFRETRASDNAYLVHEMSYGGAVIELIDVPHLQSQGVCWARNLIQQHYQYEKYTLQLDSHHRFVERWDAMLINMLESLRERSQKPILTGYLPAFDPENDPAGRIMSPTVMTFGRFNADGFLKFDARYFNEIEAAEGAVRARSSNERPIQR